MSANLQRLTLTICSVIMPAVTHAQNPIQQENAMPGHTTWLLTKPALNREIEGFASATSVNVGGTIRFYVNAGTPAGGPDTPYKFAIYRMGYYGGKGARRVYGYAERNAPYQPDPLASGGDDDYRQYGLIRCNWTDNYPAFQIPVDWVSGVYVVKLERVPDGWQSYIIFVVREDNRRSDFLFQSSVTTYQAYNNWPGPDQEDPRHEVCQEGGQGPKSARFSGKSLYAFNSSAYPPEPPPREPECFPRAAVKVSFDRPYALRADPYPLVDGRPGIDPEAARGVGAGEFFTNLTGPCASRARGWEYSMVRFLERNGYDVTYATNIDVHANASILLNHRAFLSVGHDEYWTMDMRLHVEQALQAGVNLAFFSANTAFWHVRLEDSDRTIVSYKYSPDGDVGRDYIDEKDPGVPGYTTVLFRSVWVYPPLRPPAPGSLHECFLMGVCHWGGNPTGPEPYFSSSYAVIDPSHWVVRDSGAVTLEGLVGHEADETKPGVTPADVQVVAEATLPAGPVGGPNSRCEYSAVPSDKKGQVVTRAVPPIGAMVFAGGSVQWSWGLDDYDVTCPDPANPNNCLFPGSPYPEPLPPIATASIQKITNNILERFRSYDRADVFYRGNDNTLKRLARVGGVWSQGTVPADFGILTMGPAVASVGIDRLSVAAVGLGGGVRVADWNGTTWSSWVDLAGGLSSDPAMASWAEDRLDIFGRGWDGTVQHKPRSAGVWGDWVSLGPGVQGGVAAASWGLGNLSVFGVDPEGHVVTKWWTGKEWETSWHMIVPTGPTFVTDPAAASWGPNRYDVVAVGSDGAVWHAAYANGDWVGWTSLGTASPGGFGTTPPAISSWATGRLLVLARSSDGSIVSKTWDGTNWSTGWDVVGSGQTTTSSPDAVSWYGRR